MEFVSPEDVALLRRFEPIACFNRGEQFFPMNVDRYLNDAQLCVYHTNGMHQTLVPHGSLNGDQLAHLWRDDTEAVYYLNAVQPLPPTQVLAFRRTSSLREFHAGQGRLARVGITARVADLLFSLTLLLRGRVPGGMAAAAALRYKEHQAAREEYCYYGRVVREHGYITLQYWFFYTFNDWRSSFHGVNDHEADWEMIAIYVVEDVSGEVQPCWVAYSSHEFQGDDLRRRWDDPEVEKVGDHPLIYVAAGSHANYYSGGEYQPIAEVPYTGALLRLWERIQHFWHFKLRQAGDVGAVPRVGFVRIPFVDYARGDGRRIGPQQEHGWQLKLLQNTPDETAPAWVDSYRGLWGLYTGDLIAGEDAPAGPKYNRDGSINKRWYNPLGWCGLDKVPPPQDALVFLELQQQRLHDEQQHLQQRISDQLTLVLGLEMEAEAIQGLPHLRDREAELRQRLRTATNELNSLKERRATNDLVLEACVINARQIMAGDYRGPRDHLRLPQTATTPADLRLSRLAEVWSALSIGLLLLSSLIITQVANAWQMGVLALMGVYLFIEALFRRQVQMYIRYTVIGLALVTGLVLFYEFFWEVLGTLVLLAGLLIITENLRELRASTRYRQR